MTGMSWRPPAPADWASAAPAGHWRGRGCRPSAWGWGGRADGGRRRPVKVTDSRERWPGGPSSGGYRPGGRRRRANEDDRSCQDGVYGSCCSPLGLTYWPEIKSYHTTQKERFMSYHMFVSVLSIGVGTGGDTGAMAPSLFDQNYP